MSNIEKDLLKRSLCLTDEMRAVKDSKYGTENPKIVGGWDGMIGELLRKVRILFVLN